MWQNPLHNHTPEVYSDIAKHDCIYILYSSYPRMYLSYPSSALITYKNTYFPDSGTPCVLHDPGSISSHLHDTALWLCLWQQPSASLNIKNSGTERRAFCSLYKHQCECIAPCKLSKEKLPRDTKFDNVRVRSYPRITCRSWWNQSLFWKSSFHEAQEIISLTSSQQLGVCLASQFRDLWPLKTLHA